MLKATIIIPCYNEGERLQPDKFVSFLETNPDIGLCFVSDGSTDDTPEILQKIAESSVKKVEVMVLERNLGKAEAVRRGILHAAMPGGNQAEYLGYWDADLATPLDQLPRFLRVAEENPDLQIVMGARIRRLGARIDRRWYRHYLGRLFATAASQILHLPVYDTQCGAKIFRTTLARKLFAEPFRARWLFDLELLARAAHAIEGKRAEDAIFEVPLERWSDVTGTKMKPRHILLAPYQLVRIWIQYRK